MHLVEISRKAQDDGTTLVTVGMGADRQATITVLTSMMDGPGYVQMLESMLERQTTLERIRDRGLVQ